MFEKELERVINRYSQENASNTPDFILAQYLIACLAAWNTGIQQRETWYGRNARPSSLGENPIVGWVRLQDKKVMKYSHYKGGAFFTVFTMRKSARAAGSDVRKLEVRFLEKRKRNAQPAPKAR